MGRNTFRGDWRKLISRMEADGLICSTSTSETNTIQQNRSIRSIVSLSFLLRFIDYFLGIFEVDYDEYTVGMECKQYDEFSYMIMWILARDPEFVNTVKFQEVVDRAAALYEVDPEQLVFLDDSENGCAYDYIKGDHGLLSVK